MSKSRYNHTPVDNYQCSDFYIYFLYKSVLKGLDAKGKGKEIAVVGQETKFELTNIYSVSSFSPERLSCQLIAPNSSQPVQCTITPTQQGSCTVHYTPAVRGPHTLEISVKGREEQSKTFEVQVFPSPEMRGCPMTTSITGRHNPWGVAVSESGEVVVSESKAHCIYAFKGEKNEIGSKGSHKEQFDHPRGIALTSDNHLLVVDSYNHRLQVLTPERKFKSSLGEKGDGNLQFSFPSGIAIHPSGRVFIADTCNNRIQVLNADLTFSHTFGSQGRGQRQFSIPKDIACDSHGCVYVTDFNNHRVQKFHPDGRFISDFGNWGSGEGQLSGPIGICIDSTDTVYVSEIWNNRVSIFDSKGKFLKCFHKERNGEEMFDSSCLTKEEGVLNGPRGLAVNHTGELYVCDCDNGCVVVY